MMTTDCFYDLSKREALQLNRWYNYSMTTGWTGKKGNGKSAMMARTLRRNLEINKKYHEKLGYPIRKSAVMRTLGLRDDFVEQYADYIIFFDAIDQLPNFRDCDVYCDDITLSLSARAWDLLDLKVQDWLTGAERLGCHLYFTAVRFKRVVVDFRETTDQLFVVNKLIGSRRPTPTIPPPKRVWGIITANDVPDYEFTKDSFNEAEWVGGKWHLLTRKLIEIYDHTNIKLREGYPNYTAVVRWCYDENCPDYQKFGKPHAKVKHV